MKARELIEKLQALDPETLILACDCIYCQGGWTPAEGEFDPSASQWTGLEYVDGPAFTISGKVT